LRQNAVQGARRHVRREELPVTVRAIPSIDQLARRPGVRTLVARFGHEAVVEALRAVAAEIREQLRAGGGTADRDELADVMETRAATIVASRLRPSLRRVINATGVIVHTNFGRAPLGDAALARVAELARGYTNLEYDLAAGARGRRDVHAESLLRRLTGAEAAVVVNNCAAATMLTLAALARGREVVISRAELVEIGGGFRVPDVMVQSGARLREVGTTNRTRAADYALAIGDGTAAILRVHPSNFRIEGFVERTPVADLVALAERFSIPLIEDLGSGFTPVGTAHLAALAHEPTVQQSIAAGVDVVCFSGDKLLGGPQAGVIAGRGALLSRIRRHPLLRALRVDKLTYAALEATLAEHLAGRAEATVPVLRMAALAADAIDARAARLARTLVARGWRAEVVDGLSTIGGGSAPGAGLPTRLLALAREDLGADGLDARLRELDPPIVGRIEHDRLLLDLRTVREEEDDEIAAALSVW
jgi:L-seryl-tRNA(Ser) seleniumtransferase